MLKKRKKLAKMPKNAQFFKKYVCKNQKLAQL